jgi:hypothetical protein
MARAAEATTPIRNNQRAKPPVSDLGRKLRRISQKIAASGEKLFTRGELEQELAERRGGFR